MAGNARYTRVLVGGFSLSSQTNSIALNTQAQREEVTTFEATGKQYVVFAPESTVEIAGYTAFSATDVGTWEKIATDALSTADTVTRIFSESSTGSLPTCYQVQ